MFKRGLSLFLLGVVARAVGAGIDLDREIILAPPAGTAVVDGEIAHWQQRASRPEATEPEFERLGWAFVAHARTSLDNGYYKLAEKTADVMDARFGVTAAAMLLRGHVDHNLHRFHDAESIARKLVAERGLPEDFALLSDALMEQGNLSAAVVALQRVADLKPGAEADTRIAHIRWLKGDVEGAIAAMTSAIRVTSPSDHETVAWMMVRLAHYELQQNRPTVARQLASTALRHVSGYPPALLIAGRLELAAGRVPEAVALLEPAARANPIPEYQWALRDALAAAGATDRATAIDDALRRQGLATDPRSGALYLATECLSGAGAATVENRIHPESPVAPAGAIAVRLAQAELAVRQDVFTHDALAWASFAAGDQMRAQAEIGAAQAEHTQDARLWLHAGLIAAKAGHAAEAISLLRNCSVAALLPSEARLLRAGLATLAPGGAHAAEDRSRFEAPDPIRGTVPLCSLNTP